MPAFVIKLDNFKSVFSYLIEVRDRLKNQKAFFEGNMIFETDKQNIYIFFDLKPKFSNPFIFAVISLITYLIFHWVVFLYIAVFLFIGVFTHTESFFFMMFRWGLLKKGYGGKIKLMSKDSIIKRVMK